MTLAPPPTHRPSIAAVFARQGFVIVNRMAPEPVPAEVRDHLVARAAAGTVILAMPFGTRMAKKP
jgi:hypothetical protein